MTAQDLAAAVADVVHDHVTLALAPVLADVKLLQAQLSGWDARWNDLGALRERVAVVEALKALPTSPAADTSPAVDEAVLLRLTALEMREPVPGPSGERGADGARGERGPEGPAGSAGRDGMPGRDGMLGLPGEKGIDGTPGRDGAPGRDGTLENLKAVFDGERTVTLCFKDGTPIEGGQIIFPVQIQRGVYVDGKSYEPGDVVTWGGSQWHANEPTSMKPGDGAKAWTLIVKRGRDGRDGKDAPTLPVVSVGGIG